MWRQLAAVGGSPWLEYACVAGLGEVFVVWQCLVGYVIIIAPAPGAATATSPAAAPAATSEAAAPARPQSAAATDTKAAAMVGPPPAPPAPGALASTFEKLVLGKLLLCSALFSCFFFPCSKRGVNIRKGR